MISEIEVARAAVAFYDLHPDSPSGHLASALAGLIGAFERVDAARDEVQEKIAYLRRGCQVIPEVELRQRISAVGAAEWRLGYYWNALVQREQQRAIRAQWAQGRAEDALRELAEHGLRFDLNPTMAITTADEVYAQWAAYARRMNESVRAHATAALAATDYADGSSS